MKIGAIVFALVLAGCAPRYTQVYSGPELPRQEVALIMGEKQGAQPWPQPQEWVTIRRVDGKELDTVVGEWPTKIQVLPGHRSIEVNSDYEGYGTLTQVATEVFHPEPDQTLAIDTQADHEYLIRFQRITDKTVFPHTTQMIYWIEDMGSGEVVGGTKPAP